MHKLGFPCLTIFNVSMPHYAAAAEPLLESSRSGARTPYKHSTFEHDESQATRKCSNAQPYAAASIYEGRADRHESCSSCSLQLILGSLESMLFFSNLQACEAGLQADREPPSSCSCMRELFAFGHVIEHLHYAFSYLRSIGSRRYSIAYRELSLYTRLISNTHMENCDTLHIGGLQSRGAGYFCLSIRQAPRRLRETAFL
jgi:hypothetical protein